VAGKVELLRLLQDWLGASRAQTIGDVTSFGRTPYIFIALDKNLTAVLNADTKRSAVKLYVDETLARGNDFAWSVIANRNGRSNKLVFREDRASTPGWYCYSREALSVGDKV
jgi:hypothetical protein